MDFALSWDLVLIGIFFILFTYNFLLGQNATLKLILAIYISILTADGLTQILQDFVILPSPNLSALIISHEVGFYTALRLVLFFIAIVTFVTRGGFHINIEPHDHPVARFVIHALFSAMAVVLFLSTILLYISGKSFITGITEVHTISLYSKSYITKMLIDYYQIWFTLPAMAFLVSSFVLPAEDE